jgi:hypothetical protein
MRLGFLVFAIALLTAGCGSNSVATRPELTRFVKCLGGPGEPRVDQAATKSGFATVNMSFPHDAVAVVLVAYQVKDQPRDAPGLANFLRKAGGVQVPFAGRAVRGRAVLTLAANSPLRRVPAQYAPALRSLIARCLRP